ncbi:hypothetical protein C8R43DRAFT_1000806 [Mycena crocata]|nr:hypothetical protein C8R43DRAFT_1000806 [Mycena crocata]
MTTIDSHLNIVRIPEKVDWLGYLIGVTKLISELAPLPCLSNVAVLVLSILEPLQVLKRNRILFKELAEKVVRITVRLRDEVIADTSIAASPKFVQTCVEFHDCLLRVTGDLKEILMPHRRSWAGQYFSAHLFRPVILNAQKRVDDLIESFLLATAVGTRLRVQLVHSDLTALRRALISAEVDAEPKVADFHELIPGDIQLLTPLQPQDTAEAQQESITDHPVLVRGVRMMARLYHGENALEQWRGDLCIFTNIRDAYTLQLFGYCKSPRQPSLVFHQGCTASTNHSEAISNPHTGSSCICNRKPEMSNHRTSATLADTYGFCGCGCGGCG